MKHASFGGLYPGKVCLEPGEEHQSNNLPAIKAVHTAGPEPNASVSMPLALCFRRPAEPDSATSAECNTPFQGQNELFRVTSMRQRLQEGEYWQSLPSCSKAHLILSCLASCSILAFCIQQFVTGQEAVHILVSELIAAALMAWMAIEAVYHENAFELLASAAVACAVSARILYFLITTDVIASQVAPCIIILALLGLDLGMAIASYKQFGWRMYSKIACDFRTKSGISKQRTYLFIHSFMTILKVDLMITFILFVVGIVSGTGEPNGNNIGLLIANPIGLAASFTWLLLSFFTVRNDWTRMEMPLVFTLPLCYIQPIVSIAIACGNGITVRKASRSSLIVAAVLFILARSLTAVVMQVLIARFKLLHARSMRTLSDPNRRVSHDDVPQELVPLMKGAWVGKPSSSAQQKRRFFQLSTDGSTLRWAWNKYILLYYVMDQFDDETTQEITLKLLMEPELKLRFETKRAFETWRIGLAEARRLLHDPANLLQNLSDGQTSDEDVTYGWLRMLLFEPPERGESALKLLVKQLVHNIMHYSLFSKRRSVHDPDLQRFNKAKQRAQGQRTQAGMGGVGHKRAVSDPLETRKSVGDPRHKRGNTIPSIAEIVDVLQQEQNRAGDRVSLEMGLQRQLSAGKRFRELVIDCVSPNTRRIGVRQWGGSPSSNKSAARELFSRIKSSHDVPPPPTSPFAAIAGKDPKGGQRPRFDIQASSGRTSTSLSHHSRARSLTFTRPSLEEDKIKSSITLAHSLNAQSTLNESEGLDSRECLDVVGPLPDLVQSPSIARSPSQALPPLVLPNGVEVNQGRDHAAIEIVVHDGNTGPGFVPRFDVDSRAGSYPGSLHPLIQRTRTQSSSGSFYGQSPLPSRANSGNYTSESSSTGHSCQSHSTHTSNSSFYSSGHVKMSVPYIPIHEIIEGRCLGEGSQGRVSAGSYLETPVATKQLKDVREMEMSLHIGMHDNVVALRGISQKEQDLVLVMEYCPKGTFGLLLHGTSQRAELDAFMMAGWAKAIARGMLHLHTRNPPILHRDLKPANIFVGHGFVMKIGDFGMSRHVDMSKQPDGKTQLTRQLSSDVIGTTNYTAPELLKIFEDDENDAKAQNKEMTAEGIETILKSDVYSYGVTLWEMMARKKPFSDMNQFQIMQAWMEDTKQMELVLPPIPTGLSEAARRNLEGLSALVRDCTQLEAEKRPSFRQICQRIRELPPRSSQKEVVSQKETVSQKPPVRCIVDNARTSTNTFSTDLATVV